eukprot:10171585-Heterocapsa_arctica.AAC.1
MGSRLTTRSSYGVPEFSLQSWLVHARRSSIRHAGAMAWSHVMRCPHVVPSWFGPLSKMHAGLRASTVTWLSPVL